MCVRACGPGVSYFLSFCLSSYPSSPCRQGPGSGCGRTGSGARRGGAEIGREVLGLCVCVLVVRAFPTLCLSVFPSFFLRGSLGLRSDRRRGRHRMGGARAVGVCVCVCVRVVRAFPTFCLSVLFLSFLLSLEVDRMGICFHRACGQSRSEQVCACVWSRRFLLPVFLSVFPLFLRDRGQVQFRAGIK